MGVCLCVMICQCVVCVCDDISVCKRSVCV